jgi:hypothetical protein
MRLEDPLGPTVADRYYLQGTSCCGVPVPEAHSPSSSRKRLNLVEIDNRAHLTAVWLVDGPGPEAVWPFGLGGRYAENRGEWYFPKGTSRGAILTAGGTNDKTGNGDRESGLFDPLVEEVDEHSVQDHEADSPRLQAVTRAVKAWTDQLIDRSARNNLLFSATSAQARST